jgi:hypothetical protein
MDDVEQLKLLLKKYLEVKVNVEETGAGDTKVEVTLLFDGEEIDSDYDYSVKY